MEIITELNLRNYICLYCHEHDYLGQLLLLNCPQISVLFSIHNYCYQFIMEEPQNIYSVEEPYIP